jgi:hypothetical protein
VFHNRGGIIIANGDGSGKAGVPNTQGGDYWPAWSADGEWISFGHYSGDVAIDYFKIHPDGSGRTTLTPFHGATGDAYNPRGIWTADGANLVASGTVFGVPGLYAIPTDGSGFVRRLAITAGAAPDFVGSVTGSEVSGVLVLPPTTTSTSSTTTTSTSSTSTSVSTTSSTSTTTPTIVPPVEICGNCLDDDGDDRIDGEDTDCCPGASLGLTIARGRIKTKGATTKLALSGGIGAATGLDQHHDVVLQIRGSTGELLCARLPATSFVTKGRSVAFRDPQHRVASAAGIDLVVLRLPKHGAAKLKIQSKRAGLQAPGAGRLEVTLGVASDGGARCGTATSPFAASKNGALHFP